MKKLLVNTLAFGVLCIASTTGCRKDTTVYIQDASAVSGTVSFSKDLVPIFTKNCALSGCHADGGHIPDLMAVNAYSSLKAGSFLDTTTGTNSIVYKRLTGQLTPSMPMGGTNNPSNIEGLLIAWIKQGAKNN
jgi:hypothetical protein